MAKYKFKEFSKMTGIPEVTLRYWDNTGKLKAHRTMTNIRFYSDEHLEYLKQHTKLAELQEG